MGFAYITNLNAVINVLKNHNTTTASPDLSANLNVRVDNDNILITDPNIIQPRADRMPSIFVLYASKTEEYSGIGATGFAGHKKQGTGNIQVFGLVGKFGGYEPDETVLKDVYNLASNCEAVFQQEFTLSNTCLYCNPNTTNFNTGLNYGEGFARPFVINLSAEYLFR